jgi:hypothetical protein
MQTHLMTSSWQRDGGLPDMDAAFNAMQVEADTFTPWLGRDRTSDAKDVILYAVQPSARHALGMIASDPHPDELSVDVLKYTAVLARLLAEARGVSVEQLLPMLDDQPEFHQEFR